MSASHLNKRLIRGVIVCGLLVILLCLFNVPDFGDGWRHLRNGMTQQEVRRALGAPTWTGNTQCIGAGGVKVTRWQHKRRHWIYCIDFDYIGPGGTPVVFRTERFLDEWRWPSWWPWQPAKAKA